MVVSLISLTFGPFALSAEPQVEKGGALVQKGIWIFYADPVDVVNTKLKLSRQLWKKKQIK